MREALEQSVSKAQGWGGITYNALDQIIGCMNIVRGSFQESQNTSSYKRQARQVAPVNGAKGELLNVAGNGLVFILLGNLCFRLLCRNILVFSLALFGTDRGPDRRALKEVFVNAEMTSYTSSADFETGKLVRS